MIGQLLAPVDISFLVFFRVAFGAIMLWEVFRFFEADVITRHYIAPQFYFKYHGFDWVRPWGGQGMHLHFYGLGFLAACILVGFCYRIATALFFLGFTYICLLDQTRYLNHFYLVCLIAFLLVFVPANRAFSIDALINPRLRSRVTPAWTLWLLRAQIGIVYLYGGFAKLGPDWLQGQPMSMWLGARTHFPVMGTFFSEEWMALTFSYGGLLLDLLLVPMLLWKRTRWLGLLWCISFHLLNAWLFTIGIFPWFMLCATIILFPPAILERHWHLHRSPGDQHPDDASTPPARTPLILSFLALYLLVQMLLPFRHFAYPGEVNWTEEGHRFSWRMKLRTKDGYAQFRVVETSTGRSWDVDPNETLIPRQVESMSTHPDMILQFAHHLADDLRKKGHGEVAVYATVTASLNGREPQLLIDPSVDLAKERRNLLPARWIMPLTTSLKKAGHSGNTSPPGL